MSPPSVQVGTLYFGPGVTEQKITMEVLDDDVFEEDEHFYCRISNPRQEDHVISELDGWQLPHDSILHCTVHFASTRIIIVPE